MEKPYINIIFIIDTSKSMSGSMIESVHETIREIANVLSNTNALYSFITYSNSAKIVRECSPFEYNTYITGALGGLSNINTGLEKAYNLVKKYNNPSIIICLTDSLFSCNHLISIENNPSILEKIIICYNQIINNPTLINDFSIYYNNELGLKDMSNRILSRIESIDTKHSIKDFFKNKDDQTIKDSKEEDSDFGENDSQWN